MFLYIWSIAPMRPNADMLTTVQERTDMKRIFVHPDAKIGANASMNNSQIYNLGTKTLKQSGLDLGSEFEVGNRLASGDIEGLGEDFATKITGSKEAGMVVGSLLSIITSWQKGKDTKEAISDAQQVNTMITTANKNMDKGQAQVRGIVTDAGAVYDQIVANISDQTTTLTDSVAETTENTENVMSENEGLSSDIKALEDEKEQIQKEIETLQEKLSSLTQEEKDNGETEKINEQITAKQGNIQSIDGMIQSFSNQIVANLEASKQENEAVVALSGEQVENIEAEAVNITQLYGDTQQAINEITNLLQGNFKQIDEKVAIKMATEMTKAAVNGTEGGILAAAASAAGVGSVFSLGASSGLAVKYATASTDKFAGSVARSGKAVVMEAGKQELTSYVMNQLSVISNIVGVDLTGFYDLALQNIEESKSNLDVAQTNTTDNIETIEEKQEEATETSVT